MIVDANAHATRDGSWFGTSHDASVGRLLRELDRAGIHRAVLTGLAGCADTDAVLAMCDQHADRLVPVGAFDPSRSETPEAAVAAARRELADRGLAGFKLHPRLGGYDALDPRVLAVLDEVAGWDDPLPVWLCTLLYFPGGILCKPPVDTIHELASRFPSLPFVLAHGGGPDLLRVATAVRSLPNAYLDLSYTLTAFRGSSVDLDLKHLIRTFENRLLFGSDFPEAAPSDALSAFEALAADCDPASRVKVLGGNVAGLLGLVSEAAT